MFYVNYNFIEYFEQYINEQYNNEQYIKFYFIKYKWWVDKLDYR